MHLKLIDFHILSNDFRLGQRGLGTPRPAFSLLGALWRSSGGCRSIFWCPSNVLRSTLARLTPILLAGALPRTPWASFLEAETG